MNKGIRVNDISKAFAGRTVLSHLSLTFEPGSVSCIQGPSGSGKTTLLRILAGLETPDGGTVDRGDASLAFVFQEDRLSENYKAVSNIRLVTGKRMSEETIRQHLRELGLEEAADQPVRELSGGMKRRVAIARAVCFDADILLMDEPFKGLDRELKSKVMDYVKSHTKGKTLIYVTHDPEEAEYMGGKVIFPEENL